MALTHSRDNVTEKFDRPSHRDRSTPMPYGRQSINDRDVEAVVEALKSGWLTTGPQVEHFERDLASFCGTVHAVVVNSGTAALHAAAHAINIQEGDEVIVPAITFAATSNAVLYAGGTPVFADVNPDTLLIDLSDAESKVTPRTKAICAVDYAGQPCDYQGLRELADRHGLRLIADACHSIGASYRGRMSGSLADVSTFSFHPVKGITTGEGGALVTSHPEIAQSARQFRNHGIDTDHRLRARQGAHVYDQETLGFNYRLSDIQCALGRTQLARLPSFVYRRAELADRYHEALVTVDGVSPLTVLSDRVHAWHLYAVLLETERLGISRDEAFSRLRDMNIGVNVHYRPVYQHTYYRKRLGDLDGICPAAEAAYDRLLTLPLFPDMTAEDLDDVVYSLTRLGDPR
ncbi:TPA: UDP-4-amino-4,6-dideoxy-N-acetyl-beta-L-altrosamine transaminase [Candidatus Latescibacteria bacterium]|nr:UDP-4-amino-4,6-dideoxy-N-acetyl-beta-L-altrosamine transaminase [Gemmatimonadota bacterium]HAA77874.1 UDP-4-amino-4,6-dideoxy-N-acetyl-beta-L-altrosamine transaminase [Candidatus Latescibacterota bacterium]|tara:strand:+ start:195 stop:1406 length:1212 start_codon:yes stop_codon:yes gene_type:complete